MATKTTGGKRKAPVKQPPKSPARKPPVREPGRKKPPMKGAKKAGAYAPARAQTRSAPLVAAGVARHAHDPHHDLYHEVAQFLYRQADLLDGKRWQDYIDLFADDGIYWMPADPAETTWDGVPSIFAEDKNLMNVRMGRVQHPDAWSQRPAWGTNHVIGNVTIQKHDAKTGAIVVRSRFHMLEMRRDNIRHFAGSYEHHLERTRNGLRIKLQRVDMTNAQAAYDYVLQVWV